MDDKKIRVTIKTKQGDIDVPATLSPDGTLDIDLSGISQDDIIQE